MKVGDIVYLNSGSPELTIESINEDIATVTWFDDNGRKQLTGVSVSMFKYNQLSSLGCRI